jgi:hypothetical protein
MGTGAQYDYGFRIYDSRIGKFLSVDPLCRSYPWWTPYQFAGNTPIQSIDLDGLETHIVVNETNQDGTVVTTIYKYTTVNSEGADVPYDISLDKNQNTSSFEIWEVNIDGTGRTVSCGLRSTNFSAEEKKILEGTPKSNTLSPDGVDCFAYGKFESSPFTVPLTINTYTLESNPPTKEIPTTVNNSDSHLSVTLGIPQNLEIAFKGSNSEYANSLKAKIEIGKVVTALKENGGVTATITVGTNLKKGEKISTDYYSNNLVNDRFVAIYTSILKSDPSLYGKVIEKEEYGTENKTTVTYNK